MSQIEFGMELTFQIQLYHDTPQLQLMSQIPQSLLILLCRDTNDKLFPEIFHDTSFSPLNCL